MQGATVLGSFTLLQRVALGGSAEVWNARGSDGRVVAFKWAHAEWMPSCTLQHEARILRRAPSDACPRLHGCGIADGRSWIALDWIDGLDLGALCTAPVAPPLAALIVAELAQSVAALHECRLPEVAPHGLLHGDLTPRNVRITSAGRVRLLDLGSAIPLDAHQRAVHRAPGTLRYLAPEQLAGLLSDARTEVYALGLMLDELLIGGAAFDAEDEIALAMAVRRGEVRLPSMVQPSVPFALESICLKALSIDPAHRQSSARALAAELAQYVRDANRAVRHAHVSALVRERSRGEARHARLPRPLPIEEISTGQLYLGDAAEDAPEWAEPTEPANREWTLEPEVVLAPARRASRAERAAWCALAGGCAFAQTALLVLLLACVGLAIAGAGRSVTSRWNDAPAALLPHSNTVGGGR